MILKVLNKHDTPIYFKNKPLKFKFKNFGKRSINQLIRGTAEISKLKRGPKTCASQICQQQLQI